MHEPCPAGVLPCQCRDVVVLSGRKGASAERQSVMRIVHGIEEPLYILVACYDAWQAKYLEWRVVGMHAHVHVALVAYGHDGRQEVAHILAQLVFGDALVEREQLPEQLHGMLVVLADVSAYEALGLDDDVLHQLVVVLRCHRLPECGCLPNDVTVHFLAHSLPVLLRILALQDVDVEIGELCEAEI